MIEIDTSPLPHPNIRDLRGQTFGRLTVVAFAGSRRGTAEWACVCSCGTSVSASAGNLRGGRTKSCGCFRRERSTVHGLCRHPAYPTWRGMVDRCHNPGHTFYAYYGGRGIEVHPEWRESPIAFIAYVEQLPGFGKPSMSLDRVDNERGYEPGNLRWATTREQSRNRRSNRRIKFRGRAHCLAEWAELLGLNPNTLGERLYRNGWSVERALTEGVDPTVVAAILSTDTPA